MGEEIKKKAFIGDSGARAEIIEEERNAQSLDAQYGRTLLKQAGRLFCPIGAEYVGAAVVFYYQKDNIIEGKKDFMYACQTDVKDVVEGHADLGWKGLKTALMRSFNRSDPKERN